LYDNTDGKVPQLDSVKRKLSDSLSNRQGDYGSFMVIPIPRRKDQNARRAGLHISFREPHCVKTIWGDIICDHFSKASQLVDVTPPLLQPLLLLSLDVIEVLLRDFNEQVFDPRRRRIQ
jgi:hypothetical protein